MTPPIALSRPWILVLVTALSAMAFANFAAAESDWVFTRPQSTWTDAHESWLGTWNVSADRYFGYLTVRRDRTNEFLEGTVLLYERSTGALRYRFPYAALGELGWVTRNEISISDSWGADVVYGTDASIRIAVWRSDRGNHASGYMQIASGHRTDLRDLGTKKRFIDLAPR